jgi:hypothetical protein
MKHRAYNLAALALLSAPAFAQGGYYSRSSGPVTAPVQLQIEGGAAATVGNTANFFNSGFTLGGGVLWHPEPGPLALRTTFDYTRLGATSQLINDAAQANQANINDGTAEVYSLALNGVYEWPLAPYGYPSAHGYLTLGIGVAHERVDFTQTVLVAGPVCSWWVCGTAVTPQQSLVAHNDTTVPTWNAGVGLDFPLGGWQSFFVEAVFQRVNTPQPTTFWPIRVGVRF